MQVKCKKKKICAVYGEVAVIDGTCQKWFVSFMLEISCWMMLHGQVDQLKLIAIKSRHQLRPISIMPPRR